MPHANKTSNLLLTIITFLLGIIIWFMQQDRTAIYNSIENLDYKFQSNTEEHVCLNNTLDTINYHLISRERAVDKVYKDEFLPLKQQVTNHEKRITNVEYKTGIK
jgi:hypothetical protein